MNRSSQRQDLVGGVFAGRGYRDKDHERHGKIIYALEQQTTHRRLVVRRSCSQAWLPAAPTGSFTGNKPWDVVIAGALLITKRAAELPIIVETHGVREF